MIDGIPNRYPMVYQVSLRVQLLFEVKSDSINSILENLDFLRSQLTSGITDEVQQALVTIQGHPVFFRVSFIFRPPDQLILWLASKPPPAPRMQGYFMVITMVSLTYSLTKQTQMTASESEEDRIRKSDFDILSRS